MHRRTAHRLFPTRGQSSHRRRLVASPGPSPGGVGRTAALHLNHGSITCFIRTHWTSRQYPPQESPPHADPPPTTTGICSATVARGTGAPIASRALLVLLGKTSAPAPPTLIDLVPVIYSRLQVRNNPQCLVVVGTPPRVGIRSCRGHVLLLLPRRKCR